jgi:formamidopyrimidine-DNA glycosylase
MAKEKRAGVWVVGGDPAAQAPLAGLGPDALGISREALAAALAAYKSMRVHGFLRDQRAIAGIGRRLSSEICWRAKLSPFASTHKLTADEIDRLHAALAACIDDALAFERGREAMSSSAERPGSVYKRAGERCPVCDDTIRAVEYNAYTVNYCATCQTDGKVLADNTTSKFLK